MSFIIYTFDRDVVGVGLPNCTIPRDIASRPESATILSGENFEVGGSP